MLPLLVCNPGLVTVDCECSHSQHHCKDHPNQSCQHKVPSTTFAFQPWLQPSAWGWILQFFKQICKICTEIVISYLFLVVVSNRCGFEAKAIWVERRFGDERSKQSARLWIPERKEDLLNGIKTLKRKLTRKSTAGYLSVDNIRIERKRQVKTWSKNEHGW